MSFFLDSLSALECRDANAVAAAVLADLPAGKGLEEEIEGEGGCFLRELTQDLPACHAATISPHTNEPCLSDGRSTIALNHIGKDGNVKTSTKARAAKVLIQLNF